MVVILEIIGQCDIKHYDVAANKINNGNNEIFLIFTLVKKDEDIGNTELIVLYAKDLFKKKDLTRGVNNTHQLPDTLQYC
jgi:hypothetical protein